MGSVGAVSPAGLGGVRDTDVLRPTALELAWGGMYGEYAGADGPGSPDHSDLTPLAALEEAVVPALKRPPCRVSFSGGRDSSAVLAAATRAARREGLPPPVPTILRVPDAPATEESQWQELVLRHLGLREYEVQEVGDDVDLLGPHAAATLRRHGILYPGNAFLLRRQLQGAEEGSLLDGWGGDQLFGSWRWRRQADVLARRRRPTPRDIPRLAYAASPVGVRRRRESRNRGWVPLWLRPEAARLASEVAAAETSTIPLSWHGWVGWCARQRANCACVWSLGLIAAEAGVLLLHPLLHPGFLSALAKAGGRLGFGNRTAAMRAIFGDALPEKVLSRRSKAFFHEAFWRRQSREFARRWDGNGVDHELVDAEALRREWQSPIPDQRSSMLLQAAWLSEQG